MGARRIAALPLLLLGGLVIVATNLAAFAAALYYEWQGLQKILDGDVVSGVLIMGFVAMLAASVVSLLGFPGAALLHAGARLWGSDDEL